jgi:hypothetical protein
MEQPPFPRVLLLVGKGQLRVSAPSKYAHPGATDEGSFQPGANMAITLATNDETGDRISRLTDAGRVAARAIVGHSW